MSQHSSGQLPANLPQDGDASQPSDTHVQSLARGLSVIRSFSKQRPEQTMSEVAAAADLTRAGARRILLTLVGLGYVGVRGRQFFLTPKVLDLGFAYLTSMPLWGLAEPILERFVAKSQESSSAAVLDGGEVVYVLRVPTHKIITINLGVGSRLPAYCTSMGRVLLSGLTPDELDRQLNSMTLRAHTASTLVDRADIVKEIDRVRTQGWALVDEELEVGLVSLAAPIHARSGEIIAAINVSGHKNRTSTQFMIDNLLPDLRLAANEISRCLQLTRN